MREGYRDDAVVASPAQRPMPRIEALSWRPM